MTSPRATLAAVHPPWAVPGGRITLRGSHLLPGSGRPPTVHLGDQPAHVVHASPAALSVLVPFGCPGGRVPIRVEGVSGETALVEVGVQIAEGLHQVDSPAVDRDGNLYLTFSGRRGERAPVSIFRVRPQGTAEPFVSGVVNPTSLAIGPDSLLYVSSRFEGVVYRIRPDGTAEAVATELGVACGVAFGADGALYVGDRTGTIFRVTGDGRAVPFAELPPSVAAFHLAFGPDRCLYVTAPTLASRDDVYRVDPRGRVEVIYSGFGRPQGLAFDSAGALYVVDALAGDAGLYRLDVGSRPAGEAPRATLVLAAQALVGVALDPRGGLIVCSAERAYRLGVNLHPAEKFS